MGPERSPPRFFVVTPPLVRAERVLDLGEEKKYLEKKYLAPPGGRPRTPRLSSPIPQPGRWGRSSTRRTSSTSHKPNGRLIGAALSRTSTSHTRYAARKRHWSHALLPSPHVHHCAAASRCLRYCRSTAARSLSARSRDPRCAPPMASSSTCSTSCRT